MECVSSKKAQLPSDCYDFEVASANVAISVDHKDANTEQSSSPQHSNVATPTETGEPHLQAVGDLSTEQQASSGRIACTAEGVGAGEQTVPSTIEALEASEDQNSISGDESADFSTTTEGSNIDRPQAVRVPGALTVDDSEEEMISLEARALISDEILLRDCQRSSSSCASSSLSQETTMHDNTTDYITQASQGGTKTVAINSGTPTLTLVHRNRPLTSDTSQDTGHKFVKLGEISQGMSEASAASDLHAGGGERELSAKSSCIFVDMSSLNLDQLQVDHNEEGGQSSQ